jgi:hypothetical protein
MRTTLRVIAIISFVSGLYSIGLYFAQGSTVPVWLVVAMVFDLVFLHLQGSGPDA